MSIIQAFVLALHFVAGFSLLIFFIVSIIAIIPFCFVGEGKLTWKWLYGTILVFMWVVLVIYVLSNCGTWFSADWFGVKLPYFGLY